MSAALNHAELLELLDQRYAELRRLAGLRHGMTRAVILHRAAEVYQLRESIAASAPVISTEPPRRVVDGIAHGTGSGYRYHGCRCEDCTAKVREEFRAYRARKRAAEREREGAPV